MFTARIKSAGLTLRRQPPFLFRRLASEEELRRRAHHLRGPHRLEGELGVDGLDALDAQGLGLDLFLDHIPHRTHRARQAKGYVHVASLIVNADIIDQPKLYQIHPDLRVYNVPELIPYAFFG